MGEGTVGAAGVTLAVPGPGVPAAECPGGFQGGGEFAREGGPGEQQGWGKGSGGDVPAQLEGDTFLVKQIFEY